MKKAINSHYRDIISRTVDDTGLDVEIIDTICKCFLFELAEELISKSAVEVPYIGDLNLKKKTLDPNKFLKDFKNRGESYAVSFKRKYAEALKRGREQRKRSGSSVSGSGVDNGVFENIEDNISE